MPLLLGIYVEKTDDTTQQLLEKAKKAVQTRISNIRTRKQGRKEEEKRGDDETAESCAQKAEILERWLVTMEHGPHHRTESLKH